MKKIIYYLLFLFPIVGISQVQDSTQRKIRIPNTVNFRDLGGYKTTDNKAVKWGKIYRSAALDKLTPPAFDSLQKRKVSTVIDFRGTKEMEHAKDQLPLNVRYVHCPQGSENTGAALKNLSNNSSGDPIMISFYDNLDSIKDRTKIFFKELLHLPDNESLIFHCTAGKDRTGMAAALFLSALKVPQEIVMQDYLASNYYRKNVNQNEAINIEKMYHLNPKVAEDLMSVKSAYLNATFDAITKQYGSIENYLKKSIGLTKRDIKILRKKYTE